MKIENPTADVSPASIATFTPRERALTPKEIRIFYSLLELVATLPTVRLEHFPISVKHGYWIKKMP